MSYNFRKYRAIPIILGFFMIVAAAAGIFFYIEKTQAASAIQTIENKSYEEYAVFTENTKVYQPIGFSLEENVEENLSKSTYITPLGFPIESYSEKWQGVRLIEIYDELLRNSHGGEINYISKVIVNAGMSEMGTADSVVAGTHSSTQEDYSVFFDIPSVMPSTLEYGLKSKQSIIELYNMDEYNTIEEAARTISHEYGHHFTIYYFMDDDETALNSQYYNLRNFISLALAIGLFFIIRFAIRKRR